MGREIKYSEETINNILNGLNTLTVNGYAQMEVILGIRDVLLKGTLIESEEKETTND